MSVPQPKKCKDCAAQGVTAMRPTPHAGPRCTTHHREHRKRTKARVHGQRVEKTYGITSEDYAALYLSQNGKCYVCQKATGATKKLAVDHDHHRGCGHDPAVGCRACIRCLACGPCNQVVLGRYDAAALARAIMVLETLPAQAVLNPQGRQGI